MHTYIHHSSHTHTPHTCTWHTHKHHTHIAHKPHAHTSHIHITNTTHIYTHTTLFTQNTLHIHTTHTHTNICILHLHHKHTTRPLHIPCSYTRTPHTTHILTHTQRNMITSSSDFTRKLLTQWWNSEEINSFLVQFDLDSQLLRLSSFPP